MARLRIIGLQIEKNDMFGKQHNMYTNNVISIKIFINEEITQVNDHNINIISHADENDLQ